MSPQIESPASETDPQPVTPDATRTAAQRAAGGEESASGRRPSETATCSGCPERWTGRSVAHCAACHRTFSGVSAFDRHRSVRGDHGACVDPADIPGIEHRDGMWRGPAMDADALAARTGAR